MEYSWVKIVSLTRDGLENISYEDYMNNLMNGTIKMFTYTKNVSSTKEAGLVFFVDANEGVANYAGECPAQKVKKENGTVAIEINKIIRLTKPVSTKELEYKGHIKKHSRNKKYDELVAIYRGLQSGLGIDYQRSERLGFGKQIIFYGPPGTGKTRAAKIEAAKIAGIEFSKVDEEIEKTDGRIKLVQFHPAYSYFDFVEGIEAGEEGFKLKDKVFKEFADKADRALNANKTQDSNVDDTGTEASDKKIIEDNNNYVLIIDEINRANMASVFGELLYALEYRGKKISTSGSTLVVPDNLYIIGTMNTADVSIAGIDYAVRRRFDFIKMDSHMPDGEFFNRVYENEIYIIERNKIKLEDQEWQDLSEWKYDENDNLSSYMVGDDKWFISNLYNRVRLDIQKSIVRGVEVEDIMPGISYFLVNTKDDKVDEEHLQYKINYELVPLLVEYAKNGLFSKRYKIDSGESLYEKLNNMTYSAWLNNWLKEKAEDKESLGDKK